MARRMTNTMTRPARTGLRFLKATRPRRRNRGSLSIGPSREVRLAEAHNVTSAHRQEQVAALQDPLEFFSNLFPISHIHDIGVPGVTGRQGDDFPGDPGYRLLARGIDVGH